jgi:hypothetical protein
VPDWCAADMVREPAQYRQLLARYLRLDGELAERASPSSSVVEARAH